MARRLAGLTIRQLSEESGVPAPRISAIESGRHSNVTIQTLLRLLAPCNCNIALVDMDDPAALPNDYINDVRLQNVLSLVDAIET